MRRIVPLPSSLTLTLTLTLTLGGAACNDSGGGEQMPPPPATPVEEIGLSDTLVAPMLSAPVDVVRDEWGIPHIYGATVPDVSFGQGYVMAMDRLVQMDLARHQGDGSLGELVGGLFPDTINSDIVLRMHHMRRTSQEAWDELKASSDASDQLITKALSSFTAGVNAFIKDLQENRDKKFDFPSALFLTYNPMTTKPWTEVDSLLLGQLQAFSLSFDANSEIHYSQVAEAARVKFGEGLDPQYASRRELGKDLMIFAPVDPTYTISGWTGMNGDTSTASLGSGPGGVRGGSLLALLGADAPSVARMGRDRLAFPWLGSNNWVVGPRLSTSGNALVANDTHLSLGNPATFYLVHVKVGKGGDYDVMGVQFPGIPGVILGNNEHVAWGATVNYIDVTDVYAETIVPCAMGSSKPCALVGGKQVPLTERTEVIGNGKFGNVSTTYKVTLYEVPGHGPIIPRPTKEHGVEALGPSELSVKYTGYDKAQLFRAIFNLDRARTAKEAQAALDRDFKVGGQNWVIADDQGNIDWTQIIRVPRRAAGHPPWMVLPGDGSAEWGADMDPKYIPHAYNPEKGYLATANADPIGVTDDGNPWNEPMVDGAPLYLGADYDAGTRVGRITKRIEEAKTAGRKLSLDDMQSIQADAISEWGEKFQRTASDAAIAVKEELDRPGTHPELGAIAKEFDATSRGQLPVVADLIKSWSLDTPSGAAEDNPGPQTQKDAAATLLVHTFVGFLAKRAIGDEINALGVGIDGEHQLKLLALMCTAPEKLATGVSISTHDALLFDDMTTPAIENRIQMAALALQDTLGVLSKRFGADPLAWRWGEAHHLTLAFPAPVPELSIPNAKSDPMYPSGFPRHGAMGTVDVGGGSGDVVAVGRTGAVNFDYDSGPAIRFVCEMDPKTGPRARNTLPGGEVFDPTHYHYRDQMEPWRHNKTFDLAFRDDDVLASARREYLAHKDHPLHPAGRVRFSPR